MRSRRGTDRARLPVDEEHVGAEDGGPVEQGRPEILTLAGTALVEQGGQHADDRHHGVGGIGHPESHIEGGVALGDRAGLVLDAARSLIERIESTELRQRSLRSIGVGVAVDEIGVASLQRFVVDPQAGRSALRHVVMDHVGYLGQPHHHFETFGVLDVDGDVLLAALASEERHARHAHAVTAHRFDLDDLGTQVAEDHGAVRTGQVLAEVQHDDAAQRPHQDAAPTAPRSSRPSISSPE